MILKLGDIVTMNTDAIACPAHSDLRSVPGIREAVFQAADTAKLRQLCKAKGRVEIGKAVVTASCGLNCKYIIHVIGPGWYSGRETDRQLFAACYLNALRVAWVYRCRSVALPLMFSGDSHIPRAQALAIVCQVVAEFEKHHKDLEIYLVLYKESIYRLAEKVYDGMQNGTLLPDRKLVPRSWNF